MITLKLKEDLVFYSVQLTVKMCCKMVRKMEKNVGDEKI